MRSMTIEELYEKLSSKEFQDTEHGDIFYNFYLFQYNAEEEYSIRRQIERFTVNLARPTNYLDVLKLNLFDEFCRFLDGMPFGKLDDSQLHYFLSKDNAGQHDAVLKSLTAKANSRQFYEYINRRIMEHVNAESTGKKPYVFLYGIGSMFPFLRTSVFLSGYEEFNETSKYKIIVFYPGESEENSFSLFGKINDRHTYRAILLIND